MLLKRESVFNLFNNLSQFSDLKEPGFLKFKYFVTKNRRILNEEVEAMKEILKPSEEFQKYEKDRISYCMSKAAKDVSGEVVWDIPNQLPKYEDPQEVQKYVIELAKQNEDILKKQEEQEKENQKFLQEKVEVPVLTISQSELPLSITMTQLDSILDLVQD